MKEWQKTALWFVVGFVAVYAWRSSQAAGTKDAKKIAAAANSKDAAFQPTSDLFSTGPFLDNTEFGGSYTPTLYSVLEGSSGDGAAASALPATSPLDIYNIV